MKHLARLGAIAAVGLGLLGPGVAKADLIPSLVAGPTKVLSGTFTGDWAWTYQVDISSTALVNGSSVTIVDFQGLDVANFGITLGGSTTPLGWNLSNSFLTTQPTGVSVADSPSIHNVAVTYNGATPVPNGSFSFVVYSLPDYGATNTGIYFYNDKNLPNTGQGGILVSAIPEPSQMALAGVAGLFAIGGLVSRYRKSA